MKKSKLYPYKVSETQTIAKIGILSAIAFVIMFFQFPLPFAPPFMKVDLSDVPSLIGAFALGPVPGIIIVLIKNLLHGIIQGTSTQFIGELSNFIIGSVFVTTASIVYHREKTFKTAIIGTILGVLLMSIAATLSNYYFVFPLYAKAFGIDLKSLVDIVAEVNGMITSYESMMLFAVFPFNIIKGTIVGLVTTLLYKRVSPILHR